VANAPDYSPSAIAEHAVGMMLLLNRNFIEAEEKVSRHDFRLKGLVGKELRTQTVGIVGVGSIGEKLTEILHGFGSDILLYDVKPNEDLEKKFNARYVDLDALCRKSDIVSIHAPLNEETKHMINREKIQIMKDGVILLNLGRGAVVNTDDLIEALKSGKVGKAGLDVYENEKGLFFYDHSGEPVKDETFAYLESNNNVFITTHQAFSTEDALANMTRMAFECLDKWEEGRDPESML
jgi:D-lactate dehydrogenase